MKKTMILMGLALVSSSAFAAGDLDAVEVNCSNHLPAEQGLRVVINVEDSAKITKVYQNTFVGDRQLGDPIVVTLNNKGMERIYSGNGFTLDIALESFAPTTVHPCRLTLGGKNANLKCTIEK